MAEWRDSGLNIDVAVNLSAPDIMDPQLVEEIQASPAEVQHAGLGAPGARDH